MAWYPALGKCSWYVGLILMTITRINKIFDLLTEVAIATPPMASAKISAAIVYKGRIISIGTNSTKTSPFQKMFSHHGEAIHLHAETSAIKNALRNIDESDLSKCSIFVCRVKKINNHSNNWIWGISKPCKGCQRAIATFNIKNVYYTNDHGSISIL